MKIENIEVDNKKIKPLPDDVFIFEVKEVLTTEQVLSIRKEIERILPKNKLLILSDGIKLKDLLKIDEIKDYINANT